MRINQLETEVQQLADEVQDLKRGQAAQIRRAAGDGGLGGEEFPGNEGFEGRQRQAGADPAQKVAAAETGPALGGLAGVGIGVWIHRASPYFSWARARAGGSGWATPTVVAARVFWNGTDSTTPSWRTEKRPLFCCNCSTI